MTTEREKGDGLRERARLEASYGGDSGVEGCERKNRVIQELLAALDAAEADAARYRWLRHGDNDEEVMMTYHGEGKRKFDPRFDASWLPRTTGSTPTLPASPPPHPHRRASRENA